MNLNEFNQTLIVKNQLINAPIDFLLNYYSYENNYSVFLDNIISIIEKENMFFIIDENIIKKINKIIDNYKFELDILDSKKIEYIKYSLDRINNIEPYIKTLKLNSHLAYQEDLRDTTFINNEEYMQSLAYDSLTLNAILKNDFTYIERYDLFIYSLNYLLKAIPDLFKYNSIYDTVVTNIIMMEDSLDIKTRVYKVKIDYQK